MTNFKNPKAIFVYDPKVPKFEEDTEAFYDALTTTPGSTYVTILAARMTTARNNLKNLHDAEIATYSGGTVEARDLAKDIVVDDVREFVRDVQAAADAAPNPETAVTIIVSCGLRTTKDYSKNIQDFSIVVNVDNHGLLIINFKAIEKGKNANYALLVSLDGQTFTTVKSTGVHRFIYPHAQLPGVKLIFKGIVTYREKKQDIQKTFGPITIFTS